MLKNMFQEVIISFVSHERRGGNNSEMNQRRGEFRQKKTQAGEGNKLWEPLSFGEA